MSLRRPESVLVVIHTPTEILLLKRNADFLFWQSVTGSLEPDETPANAATRELFEETGIAGVDLVDCQHHAWFDISPRWRDRYPPGVTRNKEHVFLCPLPARVAIKLSPSEHTEYVWIKFDEVLEMVTSATNRGAIEQFVFQTGVS